MLLVDLARTSRDVAATRGRLEKIARLSSLLRRLEPGERAPSVSWLAGDLAQGSIGLGWAGVREALQASQPAPSPSLSIADLERAIAAFASARGPGSASARRDVLGELFARAGEEEREFLSGLFTGELRQGALEGIVTEAVALAAGAPAEEVRRAAMLAGSLPKVAEAVLAEGPVALARFSLRLLEPVKPMLAQTAGSVAEALEALGGTAALEWKLDGARVQVHRRGEEVRIFSRALREVTSALPEVVAVARAARATELVLDGEALALRPDGTPEPFQVTMSRFGRRLDVDRLAPELPLTALFFDILEKDGRDLLALSCAQRYEELASAVPERQRVPRRVVSDPAQGEAFLAEALSRGHEGLVVKALGAPYQAGRRGGAWLKVKRAHTLDLVVLAVEPGSGRRRGWLSNLHLGARDPQGGGFAMLGKTFKGMTDEMLAWQTERLRALALAEEGHAVRVRPELVVEVAFDGIQASSRYPAGLALRFARVKRYREDKRAEEADTIETVRALYARQAGTSAGEGASSDEGEPDGPRP